MAWVASPTERVARDVIAIDGKIDAKTLRRSVDRASSTTALHVVIAFAADAQPVIGQKAVASGGNGIVIGRRVLFERLGLDGALVTADVIPCQSETARTAGATTCSHARATARPCMRT